MHIMEVYPLEIENVKKLFNIVGLTPPMRIANGDLLSFAGYLLRCKQNITEQVNYDVVALNPYGSYVYEHLDNDLKNRYSKAKKWVDTMLPGFYLQVPVGPTNGGKRGEDEFRRLFVDLNEDEVIVFTKMIVKTANDKYLPSFSPIAMVWHLSQVDEDTGEIMPVHGHILFRATIEPSAKELSFIG